MYEVNKVVEKVDDNTIRADKVTPAVPEKVESTEYKYEFLLKQKEQIQSDYDRDAATLTVRQKELDEINFLISEADKLGVKPKLVEEIKPIEEPVEGIIDG